MINKLSKLQEIARAATPGPYSIAMTSDTFAKTLVGKLKTKGLGEYKSGTIVAQFFGDTLGQAELDAEYLQTFNPRLIEKLLAEVMASRFVDEFVIEGGGPALVKREMRLYEAREALDAELSPKEQRE